MLGIIVQLAISWLIIWLFEKGNLSFLGLYPSQKKHLTLFWFLLLQVLVVQQDFC
jgi:cytosine/uracil/thiamine/allantoin permease